MQSRGICKAVHAIESAIKYDLIDAATRGLPVVMLRQFKVTMIGAGSRFTPQLNIDILSIPGNVDGTLGLVDIDASRRATMQRLIQKWIDQKGLTAKWNGVSSTDRLEILPTTDDHTNCIEGSGHACVCHDNDIPKRVDVAFRRIYHLVQLPRVGVRPVIPKVCRFD